MNYKKFVGIYWYIYFIYFLEVKKVPPRTNADESKEVHSERSSPSPSPGLVKKTTFAALPQSTTTWQQQQQAMQNQTSEPSSENGKLFFLFFLLIIYCAILIIRNN